MASPPGHDAEQALKLSERRLSLAIRATSDAIWEWNLQTNETYYSPRWYEILGHADQAFPMTFDAWKSLCHPEDFQRSVDTIAQTLSKPQSSGYEVEFRMRAVDGSYRWILGRGNVVERDAQGKPLLLSGTNTDITERKRAAEKNAENERRLFFLTDNLPTCMLYQLRTSGVEHRQFTYVSGAVQRLHGASAEQVLADPGVIYRQVHEDDRARLEAGERRAIQTKSRFEIETRFVVDGKVRWALVRSSPQELSNGDLLWDGVEVDITIAKEQEAEQARLEASLRQAQKMESVGRLAGGIAHDFNNMLTAIKGNIAIAEFELPAGSSVREHLNEALRAAESAENLTRQLLAFSRKQVILPRVLSLNQIVQRMQKMLARVLGEDVQLVVELAPELPEVRVDPGQVEQILVNLAVNARDAMPNGGRLSVSTQAVAVDGARAQRLQVPAGRYVQLSVGDTGTGMTAEVKARLFEPFFTTKGVGKGTGLGLAMVYGAVKQSDGAIEVYSELDQGSVFQLYFPIAQGSTDSLSSTPPAAMERGHETVLLVEDEDVVRAVAKTVLNRQGYRVLAFASAAEALAGIEKLEEPLHLLLTDLVMPGMGGRELAQSILALRPQLKVLYTSGYTEDLAVHRGIAERDIAFIAKPYSIHDLASKVRQVLDGK